MVSFSYRERLLVFALVAAVLAAWIIDEMRMHGALEVSHNRAASGVRVSAKNN